MKLNVENITYSISLSEGITRDLRRRVLKRDLVKGDHYIFSRISNITASSLLDNYPVSNILDHNFETAWVEGKKGHGIGEKIRIELSNPIQLFQIIIMNGYQKSLKTSLLLFTLLFLI